MTFNIAIKDELAKQLEAAISDVDKQQRYPKGLLSWLDEIVHNSIQNLVTQQVTGFPDIHKEVIEIKAREAALFEGLAECVLISKKVRR